MYDITNRCPVCDRRLEEQSSYSDTSGLLEEHGSCVNFGHYYSYDFAYGSTKEQINSISIITDWSDSKEELRDKMEIRRKAIALVSTSKRNQNNNKS